MRSKADISQLNLPHDVSGLGAHLLLLLNKYINKISKIIYLFFKCSTGALLGPTSASLAVGVRLRLLLGTKSRPIDRQTERDLC